MHTVCNILKIKKKKVRSARYSNGLQGSCTSTGLHGFPLNTDNKTGMFGKVKMTEVLLSTW